MTIIQLIKKFLVDMEPESSSLSTTKHHKDPIVSQFNPFHMFIMYFFKIYFINIFPSMLQIPWCRVFLEKLIVT